MHAGVLRHPQSSHYYTNVSLTSKGGPIKTISKHDFRDYPYPKVNLYRRSMFLVTPKTFIYSRVVRTTSKKMLFSRNGWRYEPFVYKAFVKKVSVSATKTT
jgi:hypothetical protein